MNQMQRALQELGYTAHVRLRTLRRAAERNTKIQVQTAGSHYKARWKGRSAFCFGRTREEAFQRAKDLLVSVR